MTPATNKQREQRQQRLTAVFDVVLSVFAVVLLGLFALELAANLQEPWASWVTRGQTAIWIVFVTAFLVELGVAPSKPRYLREHWLVALSLAIPLLRVFRVLHGLRVLRGARGVRGFNLARAATMTNRAIRSLSDVARVTQVGYLVVVTVLITLVGAAAVTFFERGAADTAITSFGEGLWWSSTMISTVSGPNEPVTFEGRVVAVVLRVFGLVVVGYFTARLAVYFLGGHPGIKQEGQQADFAELREEIARLAEAVREQRRQ